MRLVREGKTFGTRLSRCDLVIEHAVHLAKFERKGVPTVSPSPSVIVSRYRALRTRLILDEANTVADKAREKASVASTPKARERALAAGILKVREVAETLDDTSGVKTLEQRLRHEIHRVTLDGFLEAARKAEFKGNVRKAIDQYKEALFFIRNDDIDDTQQESEISEIESKLKELGDT
ncbi:MAG: hypothetical protein PHN82_05965 [bacterium]|nr:hypothetical protein [bacterium]